MADFKIENLSFEYPATGKKALDNVNLSIKQGEYIVVCGKSGSGKTTLLRHLKSVLTPHGNVGGEILLDGRPLKEVSLREQSSKIGYVMQNPDNQIVTDKVWHELAFGLESLGCDKRTMRLRVAEMASYFGIQSWFHSDVSSLSGGQKQLLNLASIMAMQPTVIILDEPTSQLDPIAAMDFLSTVRKINLELGTTIIISEHRLEEVFPSADRVIIMENGRVAADESPRTIGNTLMKQNSDMLASLPSPMKIYYAVNSAQSCPLTVREGRSWLSNELDSVKQNQLPLENEYEEPISPAIELKEVWFRYDKSSPDVLKGACLKIEKNTLHAILGGNGMGKSTMLKTICNIEKPYRGDVFIEGKKLSKYKTSELFKGCLAMLPQDPQSLFVKKTVEEDLLEMLDGKDASAIEKTAEICEVTHLLKSHPYDLSGGEQQRAALAKVLLCEPKYLLLDEPTKGIDSFFKLKLEIGRASCRERV